MGKAPDERHERKEAGRGVEEPRGKEFAEISFVERVRT